MEEIILTKQSGSEELKRYFTAVLELSKQDNKFPINLDEVWLLVYSAKEKAVRALKKNFIEGEDFVTLTQKGEGGKFSTIVYHLSVSCMEYFVARKVRPVFDVYRKVFHGYAEQRQVISQMTPLEILAQTATALAEQDKKVRMLESKTNLALENSNKNSERLEAIEKQNSEARQVLLKVELSAKEVPAQSVQDTIRELVAKYALAMNVAYRDVYETIYRKLNYIYHIRVKSYKRKKGQSALDIAKEHGFLDKIYDIISSMVRQLPTPHVNIE